MSDSQEQALPLGEFILTPGQSRYIVKEHYLREFLVQKFGPSIDFKISTKSHRWKYWAPRELKPNEVKFWIQDLDARLRWERLQHSATENIGAWASSGTTARAGARSTWD